MRQSNYEKAIRAFDTPDSSAEVSETMACFNEEASQAYTCPAGAFCCGRGHIEAESQEWSKCCVAPVDSSFKLGVWWTLALCLGALILSAAGLVLYLERKRRGSLKNRIDNSLEEAFQTTVKVNGPVKTVPSTKQGSTPGSSDIKAVPRNTASSLKPSADEAASKHRMTWNLFKTPSPAVTPPATGKNDSSKDSTGSSDSASKDSITPQPDSPVVIYPEDLRDDASLFSTPRAEERKQQDRVLHQHNSSAAYIYPSSPSTAATPGSQKSPACSPYKAASPVLQKQTAATPPLDSSSSSSSSRSTDGVKSFPPVYDTPVSSPVRGSTSLNSALQAADGSLQNTPSPSLSANRRTNRPRSRLSHFDNERSPMQEISPNKENRHKENSPSPSCGSARARSPRDFGKENRN